MAWLEKRGDIYHVNFFHGDRHFSRSLKTGSDRKAAGMQARLEENLLDVERGRLVVPPDADLVQFLLTDGRVDRKVVVGNELLLETLFDRYKKEVPGGAKESNTRYIEDIHIGHLERILGAKTVVRGVRTDTLQRYINERSTSPGRHGRPISHVTIRKEIGTFSSIWNKWALPLGLVPGPAPTRGLVYGKTKGKSPFQTREQIKRQIGRLKLTASQQRELWASAYLTLAEIQEVLDHVQSCETPWVYPMFVFAARTGARRSELLRSQREDFDFERNVVLIREKKKDRSKEFTFRHVPISPLLAEAMGEWFSVHPGGADTFCNDKGEPISVRMAHRGFIEALVGSTWSVLPGWHAFRHSFASNCAAKGIDQRIIDEWMGHQTEDMRKRYRHLFPRQQQEAMELVFEAAATRKGKMIISQSLF